MNVYFDNAHQLLDEQVGQSLVNAWDIVNALTSRKDLCFHTIAAEYVYADDNLNIYIRRYITGRPDTDKHTVPRIDTNAISIATGLHWDVIRNGFQAIPKILVKINNKTGKTSITYMNKGEYYE